jgi:hypothetical protein
MLDFNPSAGSEIKNSHPALVVSDEMLRLSNDLEFPKNIEKVK